MQGTHDSLSASILPAAASVNPPKPTVMDASKTISLAADYAFANVQPDGHFYGEMRSNSTITAEYVLMCQAMGISLVDDSHALRQWLEADQHDDGGWAVGYGLPGNISTTVEAYLALKILGVAPEEPHMCRAKDFVAKVGGLEKVRIFTRISLAMFGLFPWEAVPQLPCELIFMPDRAAFSIYRFSSWARATLVPLLVICHHKPIFALPNGKSLNNDFLNELWANSADKRVPYSPSLMDLGRKDGFFSFNLGFTMAITLADTAL